MREPRFPVESLRAGIARTGSFDGGGPWRILLLLIISGLHLLIFLWLLLRPPLQPTVERGEGRMVLVSPSFEKRAAPAAQERAEGARSSQPVIIPSPPVLLPSMEPAAAATENVTGGGSTGETNCLLAAEAGTAIENDPAAMTELADLPAGVRTEADAVMLWNGNWLSDTLPARGQSQSTVGSELRAVIQTLVGASPAPCRDKIMIGPVFVPILQSGRTTMLVIGSGQWRWSDLLPMPVACSSNATAGCSTGGAEPLNDQLF